MSLDTKRGVKRKTHAWCGASKENQASEESRSFVAQNAGRVDQSTDAVRLNGAANNGRSISSSGSGGLLGLEKLFLGIRGLGTAVGIPKEGGEDGKRSRVIKYRAESDSRRLHSGQICFGETRLV